MLPPSGGFFGLSPLLPTQIPIVGNDYYGSAELDGKAVYNMYQSTYDYARAIWDREDSAYQRMVADMKKAGLNPWMGINSGGASTSSVNPQSDALSMLLAGLSYNNEVHKTQNQSDSVIFKTLSSVISSLSGVLGSALRS